jgi:hypothetical protein
MMEMTLDKSLHSLESEIALHVCVQQYYFFIRRRLKEQLLYKSWRLAEVRPRPTPVGSPR